MLAARQLSSLCRPRQVVPHLGETSAQPIVIRLFHAISTVDRQGLAGTKRRRRKETSATIIAPGRIIRSFAPESNWREQQCSAPLVRPRKRGHLLVRLDVTFCRCRGSCDN